jgi:IclR family mhp operon transcriptional activator
MTYDGGPLRGVTRTLQVLRALNVRNGATVVELARDTGISRGALYRVLETLRDAGYVALDLSGHRYGLTMLVRSLAEGFAEEDWITEIARPALKDLQREIIWPADLATFMNDAIWIRESTRRLSPLTIDRGAAGAPFPLLQSASGRAYLAFCSAREREKILDAVRKISDHDLTALLRDFDALLADVRAKGYGVRYGEAPLESGAIAVPILVDRQAGGPSVIGCVTVTFIRRALTLDEAAAQLLVPMRRTAERIAAGVSESHARLDGDARAAA